MKNFKRFAPSAKERGALTRIYGAEENWLGVATDESKKRRMEKDRAKRQGVAL
jgi:hypothetical protein